MRHAADVEEKAELKELAARVLEMLGPEDRSMLVLKETEGLSVCELAAIFGIREEAVKVRLFRARQRVIQKLSRDARREVSRELDFSPPRKNLWVNGAFRTSPRKCCGVREALTRNGQISASASVDSFAELS